MKTEKKECATPGDLFVLLIGHGSKLPYNREMADMHARLLRDKGYRVYMAFNEITDPNIEDTMMLMIKDGAEEIVALPLFIASGKHTEKEIPFKLGIPEGYGTGKSTRYGREVTVHYNEPFGNDPDVTQILFQRLKETGCSDDAGVLLVAHGSSMRHNSDLANETSDRLRAAGIRNVFVGFNEYNEPTIEDSYAKIIDAGCDEIVVLPMFLASGTHVSEQIPEKLGIQRDRNFGIVKKGDRNIAIYYAETLGLNRGMNDILVKKIQRSGV